MKKLPPGVLPWPDDAENLTPEQIKKLYESLHAGAYHDPEAKAEMLANQAYPDGAAAAMQFGLAESGKGKLTLPYLAAQRQWPKCWPSPGQTTGSCVSKAGKNAAVVLIGVECALGLPDETSGVVETWPEVSAIAEKNGVVASEPIYGDRGHSGQGASCSRLQNYTTTKGGILIRKNYPELSIDLTVANDSIGARWGGRGTPENITAEGKKHQIRSASEAQNHEVCRDFVANGYPIWACSGLGWSSQRDANGYSRRTTRWSHSWNIIAFDDRPSTVEIYGFPLALYLHDWGVWNSGPRDIRDSASYVPADLKQEWVDKAMVNLATGNIMIPEGCMWIDARLLDSCECTAMSNFNGFPARKLPNFGATGII
jgi:hypothetical protein